ncbi:hypothetical protein BO85DRAFT_304399 [Aspergillus piperis CBS 112811]|uniref:Uncharacterized protein n=1 Tax=Aspergillus piperis CBS 112811 TaxID=1448313 RepID=A0A8G1QZX4_9EURO|nr:hypothetical protein BO85DRAFT_304399 [Aspergillus piperis CBS 112811]RAH57506.1 hypothetical protein BO85DRAFT_304399 [Aspergillus piperis CBS 112811]
MGHFFVKRKSITVDLACCISYRRDRYSLVLNITARVHTLELPPSFASDSPQMICEAVILSLRGPAASSHPRLQIFLLFFRRNARGPALVGPNAGYLLSQKLCTNTKSCVRIRIPVIGYNKTDLYFLHTAVENGETCHASGLLSSLQRISLSHCSSIPS